MTIVALSAAYGAAGSRIGPALAQRLGITFVDRGIAMAMAERLDVSVDDALAHEAPGGKSLLERLLSGFHGADAPGAPAPLPPDIVTPEDLYRASREVIRAQAATGEGVILGRGACAALHDERAVLRVRLTGPIAGRVEQALALGVADRDAAQRTLQRFDRAHAEYLQRFYGVDIDDPALYHLAVDSTAFSVDVCVDLIARAAEALASRGAAASPRL